MNKDRYLFASVIAICGLILGYLVGSFFITEKEVITVPTVRPVPINFDVPRETVFGDDAIDTSQTIEIGNGSNESPFQ